MRAHFKLLLLAASAEAARGAATADASLSLPLTAAGTAPEVSGESGSVGGVDAPDLASCIRPRAALSPSNTASSLLACISASSNDTFGSSATRVSTVGGDGCGASADSACTASRLNHTLPGFCTGTVNTMIRERSLQLCTGSAQAHLVRGALHRLIGPGNCWEEAGAVLSCDGERKQASGTPNEDEPDLALVIGSSLHGLCLVHGLPSGDGLHSDSR